MSQKELKQEVGRTDGGKKIMGEEKNRIRGIIDEFSENPEKIIKHLNYLRNKHYEVLKSFDKQDDWIDKINELYAKI